MCITEYDEQKTLKATYSEGEAKGMDLFGKLATKLVSEHRYNEITLAAEDPSYRQKLLKEYNLV